MAKKKKSEANKSVPFAIFAIIVIFAAVLIINDSTEPAPLVYSADLEDVVGKASLRGVIFKGDISGTATATHVLGSYELTATFQNLPTPEGQDFYEGWIVRQGESPSILSTGVLEQNENGEFVNTFSSSEDLTDHTFYVLTIEPNDGNPGPAAHVMEGTLVLQGSSE